MSTPVVFQHEIRDGLAEKIKSTASLSFAALAQVLEGKDLTKEDLTNPWILGNDSVKAKIGDRDLFPLKSVLVSTGWNLNDEVFHIEPTWAARHTPEDKPFNLEHNENEIIGHITASHCVDEEYKALDDNLPIDNLPAKFHIVTGAVIYQAWEDADKKAKIAQIIEEIAKGEWFVSMEAHFSGFDYAVRSKDNSFQKIIARDAESAFLTKHLRVYGGSGEYEGYKIGRVIKNINFIGKGLVRKPANPESVILTTASVFKGEQSSLGSLKKMADENKNPTLESQLIESKSQLLVVSSEKVALADQVRTSAEKITKLESEKKSLEDKVAELTTKYTDALAKSDASVKSVEAIQKKYDELQSTLLKANRVNMLIAKGMSKEDAEKKVEEFATVNDTVFTAIVAMVSPKLPPSSTNEKMANDGDAKKKISKSKGGKAKADPKEDEEVDEEEVDDEEVETEESADASLVETDDEDEGDKTVRASLSEFFSANVVKLGSGKKNKLEKVNE